MDPGYFPDSRNLEFGIVAKQINYDLNRENKKDSQTITERTSEFLKEDDTSFQSCINYQEHKNFVDKLEKKLLTGPVSNPEYYQYRQDVNNFVNHLEEKEKLDRLDIYRKNDTLLNDDSFAEKDPAEIFMKTEEHRRYNPDDAFENIQDIDLYNSVLCNTCLRIKVERSHHCRQCGRCVLKMDHHCPWLANCIGFRNYKYFCLVHIYGSILTFTVFVTFWESVAATFLQKEILFVNSWFIMYAYCANMGLLAFLLWLLYGNIKLVFSGQTVIEQSDRERFPNGKITNNYDLGGYKNFTNVFGTNPLLWFFPINANYTGDGFAFERTHKF